LLSGVEDLERRVLAACVDECLAEARPVDRDNLPEETWIAKRREECTAQPEALQGWRVEQLAELAEAPLAVAMRLQFDPDDLADDDGRLAATRYLLAISLGRTFHAAGWEVEGGVGGPPVFYARAERVQRFERLAGLFEVEGDRLGWVEWAERNGLTGLPLKPGLRRATSSLVGQSGES
jgi:hypothetical protein